MRRSLTASLAAASLAATLLGTVGCASNPAPFEVAGANPNLTPAKVVERGAATRGNVVIWGGTIVDAKNLDRYTELEVLAYPLQSNQRPDLDQAPLGRFRAQREGYLETVDYAPGREVTVKGAVEDPVSGKVGDSSYEFAVVDVHQIELWDRRQETYSEPQVHFGIGVVFGN